MDNHTRVRKEKDFIIDGKKIRTHEIKKGDLIPDGSLIIVKSYHMAWVYLKKSNGCEILGYGFSDSPYTWTRRIHDDHAMLTSFSAILSGHFHPNQIDTAWLVL